MCRHVWLCETKSDWVQIILLHFSTDSFSTVKYTEVTLQLMEIFCSIKMWYRHIMHSQVNWASHSDRLSLCVAFRSDRSSGSSFRASFSRQKVAKPLDASLPANTPYGPSTGQKHTQHTVRWMQNYGSSNNKSQCCKSTKKLNLFFPHCTFFEASISPKSTTRELWKKQDGHWQHKWTCCYCIVTVVLNKVFNIWLWLVSD